MVTDTTDARARSFDVIYLRIRCLPCEATIEAAGVGRPDAEEQLAKAVAKRRGTTPEAWRIQPRGAGPRRR
jgi:hypothetical protein